MTELQRITKYIDWLIFERKVKSRRDLADKMGYTESSLSQILNGKVTLSIKFIKKLSKTNSAVSEEWLLTGEGDMLKTDSKEVSSIEMPKEVFDRITQLIDTVCSQQSTIVDLTSMVKEQSQTINSLSKQPKGGTAQVGDIAKCADAK